LSFDQGSVVVSPLRDLTTHSLHVTVEWCHSLAFGRNARRPFHLTHHVEMLTPPLKPRVISTLFLQAGQTSHLLGFQRCYQCKEEAHTHMYKGGCWP
jgi:hypothetical protein